MTARDLFVSGSAYILFFQFGTQGGYINELSSKSLEHAEPANINHAHGECVL